MIHSFRRPVRRKSDARCGQAVWVAVPYVDLETRVRRDHPLRRIEQFADEPLAALLEEYSACHG